MATAVDPNPAIKSERHPFDTTCINTIRTLAMDAVQAANSGHPGTPMAMAPVAYYLWQYILRFDPADPVWPNRDRFVLSAGHASMLLYSLAAPDRRQGGQQGLRAARASRRSRSTRSSGSASFTADVPGHPEYRLTSGVETTTGPLGQGVANSVGMAVAERWMAAHYNRPGLRRSDRLQRLRPLRRRRHDGGDLVRGRLAGRPLEALQPLLDLRQQPHHDRRQHRAGLHRGRRHAVPGLRLERDARSATPTTSTSSSGPSRRFRRRPIGPP